jgi:hypothetical protein
MRKITILSLACAIALAAIPSASSQARLDIGAIAPKGTEIGFGDVESTNTEGFLEEWPLLPLPEADLYYQGALGHLKFGIGARAFSIVVESMAWPDAYAEFDLGRVAIEVQVGGGAFVMLGLLTKSAFGQVFIPDLSAWLKVGRSGVFRLGVGATGLYVPEVLGDAMSILFYIGGKASIMLY